MISVQEVMTIMMPATATIVALMLTTTTGAPPLNVPVDAVPLASHATSSTSSSSDDAARLEMERVRQRQQLAAKLNHAKETVDDVKLESAGMLASGIAIPVVVVATGAAVAGAAAVLGPPSTADQTLLAGLFGVVAVPAFAFSPFLVFGGLSRMNDVDAAEANVAAYQTALARLDALAPPSTRDVRY